MHNPSDVDASWRARRYCAYGGSAAVRWQSLHAARPYQPTWRCWHEIELKLQLGSQQWQGCTKPTDQQLPAARARALRGVAESAAAECRPHLELTIPAIQEILPA